MRTALSRDAILDASLRIARRDDLARLTMKKLADELDVTPMAIYRHFQNKAELLDGVLDRFVAASATTRPARSAAASDWRAWLRLTFGAMRRALLETPGVMPFLGTSYRLGPGALEVLEESLDVLREAGLDRRSAVEAFLSLMSFTLGAVGLEAAWRRDERELDPGPDERLRQWRVRIESNSSTRYPNVVGAAHELAAVTGAFPFERGLERIIDSLEREQAKNERGTHANPAL
ncbi:MAG: TetR/AcrR family transcriptional regulator C-terminal domain-containing protein [Proteobacteria bacterium]|nr:TetR/AcrR family transcriptional regulator C-terminal domain-containing protein [Pseudomonadota bacterium]